MMNGNGIYDPINLYLASLVGIFLTIFMVLVTEYFTSTKFNPVKSIAEASQTGHATNIIAGLVVSTRSTFWPIIAICASILAAYSLADIYGVAVAATSM